MKTHSTSLFLTPEEHEAFKGLAKRRGVPMTDLVAGIVRSELADGEAAGKRGWADNFDAEALLWAAARYFIGRGTGATYEFAAALADAWDDIPEGPRSIIARDLLDAYGGEGRDGVMPEDLEHNFRRSLWARALTKVKEQTDGDENR